MKKLLVVLGVLAAVIVVMVAVAYVRASGLPGGWTVERQVEIAARPQTIAAAIVDLRRWSEWAAWNRERDPEAEWRFFGADSGVGAKMAWTGPKMGRGLLEITAVEPDAIRYRMAMEGSLALEEEGATMADGSPAMGSFRLEPAGEATRLTWRDEGTMEGSVLLRLVVPQLEKMLGEHFEVGLTKLKGVAERDEASAGPAAAGGTAAVE
jgi:hypothetical protein